MIDFKGDGSLVVPAATRSVNGSVGKAPAGTTGKYTAEADCTGSLSFDGGPSFDTFMNASGTKMWMIQSNSDTVLVGTVENTMRSEPACSLETMKGTYGVLLSGTRPAPSIPAGQPGFVGQIEQLYGSVIQVYDGKGNFTQVDNLKGAISGVSSDRPGKGTYTVGPDCSFTTLVNPGPGVFILNKGIITDGAREFKGNTITPDALNVLSVGRKVH